MPRNFLEICFGPEDNLGAKEAPGGGPWGPQDTRARQSPRRAQMVCGAHGVSPTASQLHKFSEIQKP